MLTSPCLAASSGALAAGRRPDVALMSMSLAQQHRVTATYLHVQSAIAHKGAVWLPGKPLSGRTPSSVVESNLDLISTRAARPCPARSTNSKQRWAAATEAYQKHLQCPGGGSPPGLTDLPIDVALPHFASAGEEEQSKPTLSCQQWL